MRKKIIGCACLVPNLGAVASTVARSEEPVQISVRANGLVAELFIPKTSVRPLPAVIVLGGSGGGLDEDTARSIAQRGFVTLALAYFRAPGLPDGLRTDGAGPGDRGQATGE